MLFISECSETIKKSMFIFSIIFTAGDSKFDLSNGSIISYI